jgi:CheY-like chemotaxis protein
MKKFKRILLIDDDPITNFINTAVLRITGLGEAKVTLNGAEAMDYIKNECRQENLYPDLIIVDINMPVMDGLEFAKQYANLKMKETEKALVLMLTTSSDPRDVKKTNELGIKMLKKPLTAEMVKDLFGEAVNNLSKT